MKNPNKRTVSRKNSVHRRVQGTTGSGISLAVEKTKTSPKMEAKSQNVVHRCGQKGAKLTKRTFTLESGRKKTESMPAPGMPKRGKWGRQTGIGRWDMVAKTRCRAGVCRAKTVAAGVKPRALSRRNPRKNQLVEDRVQTWSDNIGTAGWHDHRGREKKRQDKNQNGTRGYHSEKWRKAAAPGDGAGEKEVDDLREGTKKKAAKRAGAEIGGNVRNKQQNKG